MLHTVPGSLHLWSKDRPPTMGLGEGGEELVYLKDKSKTFLQGPSLDEVFANEGNGVGEEDLKLSKAKREPYWFGIGRGEPYGFGIGKREPYDFGIGKREVLRFLKSRIGKREPYDFGIGKREVLSF